MADNKRRFLVCEDDPMLRRLLCRHFQIKGDTTVEAGNADEGLKIFREDTEGFDVVVTDVHLAETLGLDLAEDIRRIKPNQPVVFITGDVDEKLAERALAAGSAGYLIKPFEFFELDAAISQALVSSPAATVAPTPHATPGVDKWQQEQRTLLATAASQPIMLTSNKARRRGTSPRLKAMIALLLIVVAAFAIGFVLEQEKAEPEPVHTPSSDPQQKVIYMPYTPDQPRDARPNNTTPPPEPQITVPQSTTQ